MLERAGSPRNTNHIIGRRGTTRRWIRCRTAPTTSAGPNHPGDADEQKAQPIAPALVFPGKPAQTTKNRQHNSVQEYGTCERGRLVTTCCNGGGVYGEDCCLSGIYRDRRN